jgi:hypothetical protein
MKRLLFIAGLILLWVTAFSRDESQNDIDYKADFIVKIVDYVTWPEGAETGADDTVVIAVVGESSLTSKLTELAAAKTNSGTKMSVKTVTLEDDLTDCQILFIPTEDKAELAPILKKVNKVPVLTISDSYYFARYGVMVNFYKEEGNDKVKFEVNTMTMKFVKLKMSSKLLKLATVI